MSIELGFYSAASQIIPVLMLAEIARAALHSRGWDAQDQRVTEIHVLERDVKAAEAQRATMQAELDQDSATIAATKEELESLGARVEAERMDEYRVVQARLLVTEEKLRIQHQAMAEIKAKADWNAEHTEKLRHDNAIEYQKLRRWRARIANLMSFVLASESAGLFLTLGVLADHDLNVFGIFAAVIFAMILGCSGTALQTLAPFVFSPALTWQEKVSSVVQWGAMVSPIIAGVTVLLIVSA